MPRCRCAGAGRDPGQLGDHAGGPRAAALGEVGDRRPARGSPPRAPGCGTARRLSRSESSSSVVVAVGVLVEPRYTPILRIAPAMLLNSALGCHRMKRLSSRPTVPERGACAEYRAPDAQVCRPAGWRPRGRRSCPPRSVGPRVVLRLRAATSASRANAGPGPRPSGATAIRPPSRGGPGDRVGQGGDVVRRRRRAASRAGRSRSPAPGVEGARPSSRRVPAARRAWSGRRCGRRRRSGARQPPCWSAGPPMKCQAGRGPRTPPPCPPPGGGSPLRRATPRWASSRRSEAGKNWVTATRVTRSRHGPASRAGCRDPFSVAARFAATARRARVGSLGRIPIMPPCGRNRRPSRR